MLKRGFLELQAPTLEHTTGGAEATPFVTHHNALDEDFYLRISSELFLKRYIAGGFEKVFDIDKNYRNEGIDDEHLQEYIQFEFYWAYSDFEELLQFTEELIKYVIQNTFGTLQLSKDDQMIDWGKSYPRMSYYEFVEHYAGISLQEYDTIEKLQTLATELGLHYEKSDGYGRLVDLIYKKTARPKCIEPVWLIDHPVALSPLAKRNPNNPELTLRAQLIAYGSELTNGFAELNDPVDQLARFEEQQLLRENGDDEAMMLDQDFVEALEYGIPPTCGFAYSERLFSILMQKPIRETTAFPLMKREKL
jgi:lysyl-tRNA synthetase class 2